MARRVEYEGRIQEFPDDATDDEIRTALDRPSSLTSPQANPRANMTLDQRQGNRAMGGPPKGYESPGAPFGSGLLVSGGQDAMKGARRFLGGMDNKDYSEVAGGASDMFRGAATAASPLLIPPAVKAAVAAPLAFGTSMALGVGAQQGTERGLNALGVKPGYSQAISDVAGIAVPWAASRLLSPNPRSIGPVLENKNNPQELQALDSVRGQVRMSAGQQTGNRGLQRVEQGLENVWGASGKAQDFYRGQENDLAKVGRQVANIPGTQRTNSVGAGTGLMDRLQGRLGELKGYADKLYDSTRKTTAANVKEVQTGTLEVPASTILDVSGNPAIPAHEVAVMEKMETPVNIQPVRERLAGMYEDLMRSLPEARRANSPAFRALQDVMDSDAQQMNAMDFDKFLSAVKSLSRDGTSQYLTSKSQGVAKQIIKAGESEFQKAIETAGPNVADKLGRARAAVREYYDMDDFMSAMKDEPARVYDYMVNGGDRALNSLKYINRVAPKETQTIGRTFLDGLVDKATAEGGFRRAPGIMAEWNRLGPETKTLLFGKEQAKNIDNFMLAAKRLTEVKNPSGTASVLTALEGLGATGAALYSLATGNPVGAGAVGTAYAGSKTLANELFTPQGIQRLTSPYRLWDSPRTSAQYGISLSPSVSRQLPPIPLKSPEENER